MTLGELLPSLGVAGHAFWPLPQLVRELWNSVVARRRVEIMIVRRSQSTTLHVAAGARSAWCVLVRKYLHLLVSDDRTADSERSEVS